MNVSEKKVPLRFIVLHFVTYTILYTQLDEGFNKIMTSGEKIFSLQKGRNNKLKQVVKIFKKAIYHEKWEKPRKGVF